MATLYYNAAVDNDWATLGNWWTDDAFTTQASALPTSSDSVVLSAGVGSNSGSAPTVVNLTQDSDYLGIAVTVTGMATFNSGSYNNGTATGNATFNGSSYNNGTVTGNATFNGSSYNGTDGTITGNATFSGSAYMIGGIVQGNATFNDTSALNGVHYPDTYGTVVLNDYATANGSWYATGEPTTFNDHANLSNQYATLEPCEFNDHATCNGSGMRGGATFNDFSACAATADYGYATFTFNDSATGGLQVQNSGWLPTEPDVTYNDRSYGSGKAMTLTINGAAVMQNAYLNKYNPVLDYSFTRPQYGINGSSILGVI